LLVGADWNFDMELNELKNMIAKELSSIKQSQLKKLMDEMKVNFNNKLI
jgi:hypothetical protein